jgi:hypothetical protein
MGIIFAPASALGSSPAGSRITMLVPSQNFEPVEPGFAPGKQFARLFDGLLIGQPRKRPNARYVAVPHEKAPHGRGLA